MRLPANPSIGLPLLRSPGVLSFPLGAVNTRWYLLGRGALSAGVEAIGLRAGDEVLMPAFNHGVEIDTLVYHGLAPRFYDVGRCLGYDQADIEKAITPATRAVYVIHYAGVPQSIAPLRRLCDERGLLLIEDCALSAFAELDGRPAGAWGDMSLFSLHKMLGIPHGGVLVLNNPDTRLPMSPPRPISALATRGLKQRISGRVAVSAPAWMQRVGGEVPVFAHESSNTEAVSGRVSNWEPFVASELTYGAHAAARWTAEHTDISRVIERRRTNYERLASQLPVERHLWQELPAGACPLFGPVLVTDKRAAVRFLAERGIEAVPLWFEPHTAIEPGAYPQSEYLRRHLLEVPCHQDLASRHIDYLAGCLAEAFAAGL